MAESSSSFSSSFTTSNQQKYDVFISFRGIDTRENILSHLHAALCRNKIVSFIDNDLRRGDDVSNALLRTIEESKISIIIFSENYCSSRWCLDELIQIMKCKKENEQIVIPIFFKVAPTHVRKQSGAFGQALAQFDGHPKLQKWRDALTEAGNLSGWDSQVTRPEATLIEKIVGDISNKLYHASSSDHDGLVGIRSRIQQIESMLNACSEDVKIIGIWGMGGIGKSTLAGAFFNETFTQFEGHYFLANVREESQKHGLNSLREKLLAAILSDVNINVATPHLGLTFIRSKLRHIKVLIVFDDVDDSNHLEFLVGGHEWFGRGSVIIITCRDKQVLHNGVDCIYEIPGLDDIEAHSLFTRYAFKEKCATDTYLWKLSSKAITYAKGSPLALKILGSHLCGRSKLEQESALRKLERTPNSTVQQVLLVSYDGLDHEEKNLFLNIACFFKGEHVDEVKCFHDACGCSTNIGIRVLIDKSLITVHNEQVWMHDLLQEMGRQIVREESIEEPGKRSRLWDHCDISHVLTKNTGTEKVKGIMLDTHDIALSINSTAFEKMCNLEYLKIRVKFSRLCLPRGLKSLSNKLCHLYWDSYPLPYLPSSFRPKNLVKLIMPSSHVERLWHGRQNLAHLKHIDLSCSNNLIEIPDLSLATNLRELCLAHCHRLTDFSVKNIGNLKYLCLDGCSRIKKFPDVSNEINILHLGGTGIEEVPSSICNLKSLIGLDLGGCTRLKNLPNSIYKLKPLREIGLYMPSNEREHQEADAHLKELTDHCFWFSAVERLNLSGNNFQKIPIALKELNNLKHFHLLNCKRLQSLPQLPMNFKNIYVINCISLETVARPLSTAAKGVFNSHEDNIMFYFVNCFKLEHNARNSILVDVESRLLHWKANYPETLSQKTAGIIVFPGDDVLDWFNYKNRGSSLTTKLPPHWCNSKLFCLVFCVVLEFKDFLKYRNANFLNYNCHIRNKRGDSSSVNSDFPFTWRTKDALQSNQVFLIYDQSLINDWRMMLEEADDADEILIEFHVEENARNYCTAKECGFHLLYNHDMENPCDRSAIQHNSPYGYLTELSLNQDCLDENIEESMMQEAADNGGYNDNNYNVGNPFEELYPVRRRSKKMRWKLNMFKFPKFLRIQRKSTRKASRNYCKVKEKMDIELQ